MHRKDRHVLSHAAIYLVARGLPGIVAFFSIPLFTRLLDPDNYGRYALLITTVSLLNALLFQWLRLSLVRYLPVYEKKDSAPALKSALATTSICIVLALALVALVLYMLPACRGWRAMIWPCWFTLGIQAWFELCCEYERASLRPWSVMRMQLVRALCAVLVGALLIWMGWGWWGPVGGLAVGMFLGGAHQYIRNWRGVRFSLDRSILKSIGAYGLPLSATVALTIVIASSDRYLIAWMMGESAAGLYSVAVDFTTQTLVLLMMVVYMAAFPIAVRAWEHEGREAAEQRMRTNASILMAVGLPCVVGMSILAPGIGHCVLGKSFREAAASIMPLIAAGAFLAGLKAYHFDAAFQFAHKTIYQIWIVLFCAVVNFGLNLLVIPRFGINGAAAVSLLAYAISIALTAALGRRHFALPFPVHSAAQCAAAAALMGLVLYPLRGYQSGAALAAQVISGAAVYGLVLLATNFLEVREHALVYWRSGRHAAATPLTEIASRRAAEVADQGSSPAVHPGALN